mmetsp:Transcript_14837/g.20801  ORF Transcript_14837/g.20801 Transcript_14837/m.20801 type:complete len:91 (-) Transcript_14837:1458-1730(-)
MCLQRLHLRLHIGGIKKQRRCKERPRTADDFEDRDYITWTDGQWGQRAAERTGARDPMEARQKAKRSVDAGDVRAVSARFGEKREHRSSS